MTKENLDKLDRQILHAIPAGDGVTFAHIVASVKTAKTPACIRYRIDRLVRLEVLSMDKILGRIVIYRPSPDTDPEKASISPGRVQQAPTSAPFPGPRHAPRMGVTDD